MLFYLTSRIVSATAAFLYPGYASYKTLSQRPASEAELERWLMYWSVLGSLIGVEYLAEWLVSWIPFYYTLKAIFLLYLVLPQTQGASYIYTTYLHPFFHAHESQIDATLSSLKAQAYAFLQDRIRALWQALQAQLPALAGGASANNTNASFSPVGGQGPAGAAPQPSLGDPASGPAQLVSSLWRSYGPGIVASGAALLRTAATSASASASPSTTVASQGLVTPPGSTFRGAGASAGTPQQVLERKRQLEAELASLSSEPFPEPIPIPPAQPSRSSSASSSSGGQGLRERTYSGTGKFEEIEVPSDVEGYDVGDGKGKGKAGEEEQGHVMGRPAAATRGSWFGWGSGEGKGKEGYERVKSE